MVRRFTGFNIATTAAWTPEESARQEARLAEAGEFDGMPLDSQPVVGEGIVEKLDRALRNNPGRGRGRR